MATPQSVLSFLEADRLLDMKGELLREYKDHPRGKGSDWYPLAVEKLCVWGHERSEGMQLPPASGKWRGERLCLMVAKKCARWMSRPQERSQLRPRALLDDGGEVHAGGLERVSY